MPFASPPFRTARDAADYLARLLAGAPEERLVILYLSGQGDLLHVDEVEGVVDEVGLPLRPIVAQALRYDADALILGHNHPSGNTTPSVADIEATRRLAQVASELGISLHDHLIVTEGEVLSFRAEGLL